MEKIILYYKFVPIKDPEMTLRWQRELCERLGLKGRIIISPHGINGTLGGDVASLRQYKSQMNTSIIFKDITYKWSDGGNEHFPKLKIKVKEEIVAFDAADEIIVSERGIENGGKHLKPAALHKMLEAKKQLVKTLFSMMDVICMRPKSGVLKTLLFQTLQRAATSKLT